MPEPDMHLWSDGLLQSGFGSLAAAEVLSWPARVRRMLDVEIALARAQAQLGLITTGELDAVVAACNASALENDDPGFVRLGQAAAAAVTPVIPLLQAIREQAGTSVAGLHRGATSQDIIDNAMTLCVRDALDHIDEQLRSLADSCADHAEKHRHTVMAGRTLGQQAVPITFGLKAARWLGAVDRRIQQLVWTKDRVCQLQFGGAAGTLAAYGPQALELTEAVADQLHLPTADLPWHAERDRIAELAGVLGSIISVTGTIAGELVQLASTEIGEVVFASDPSVGSSAMPHKTNPADAIAVRAAGRLALGEIMVLLQAAGEQEHERSAGAWQAEWVALPGAIVRTAGALERTVAAVSSMTVSPQAARTNLDRGLGLTGAEALTTALAQAVDPDTATQLVSELGAAARANDRPLAEVAAEDTRVTRLLSVDLLAKILDPQATLDHVDGLIDRALATHRRLASDPEGHSQS